VILQLSGSTGLARRRSAFAANVDFVFFIVRKASVNASLLSREIPDSAPSLVMIFLIGMIIHYGYMQSRSYISDRAGSHGVKPFDQRNQFINRGVQLIAMETDTKLLIACIVFLHVDVIVEILWFSWIGLLLIASVGLLTAKHAKEVIDDHAVNHAIVGFMKENDGRTPKMIKQWRSIEIKKDQYPALQYASKPDVKDEHQRDLANPEMRLDGDVDDKKPFEP